MTHTQPAPHLRSIVHAAVKILPQHQSTLQLLSVPAVLDVPFSKFALDSRQLAKRDASSAPAAFVLLKVRLSLCKKASSMSKLPYRKRHLSLVRLTHSS
nr:hypothetical protein [Psychrobacter sp. PraFG1]UNK05518.1 hypothetical protein MN210_00920 [Psychrobacter sp. PraFG1]